MLLKYFREFMGAWPRHTLSQPHLVPWCLPGGAVNPPSLPGVSHYKCQPQRRAKRDPWVLHEGWPSSAHKESKVPVGFYCPGNFQSDSQPHFCGCLPSQNLINPKAFVCSKSPCCQDQHHLPHECTIWFEYWKVCCTFSHLFTSLTWPILIIVEVYTQKVSFLIVGQGICQRSRSGLQLCWQYFRNSR